MANLANVGFITWHHHLSPVLCGVLIALLGVWIYMLYGRMATRMSSKKAFLLLSPKILVMLFLIIALFEPTVSDERQERHGSNILALLDTSSSMDVKDDGRVSRISRAKKVLELLKKSMPSSVTVKTLEFDTQIREQVPGSKQQEEKKARGTDLGGCLLSVSEQSDFSSCAAVVLLTDGGDEPVENVAVPPAPCHVVGFGSAPSKWDDVGISGIQYPSSAERDLDFEVRADIRARASGIGNFANRLAKVTVLLEHEENGKWQKEDEQAVDLSNRRARVKFTSKCSSVGLQRYRVSVEYVGGELSLLNNSRTFEIGVEKKSVHVLFFARELGSDLKMIRSELASDPGVTFTALFRTIGERFTIQGERLPGDEELEAGFPASPGVLKLFDCVIIGSFPAEDWTNEQMGALVTYAEEGGGVIFLGGEMSFGRGGYSSTPLASLFPWVVADKEPELLRGEFPVSVPLASADNPVVAGFGKLLSETGALEEGQRPFLQSANVPGSLKPGATRLVNAGVGKRTVAVIATQRFGKGKVLAVGSNTFWKWARASEALRKAYRVLWRQAVRDLSGEVEGGRVLAVTWDKEFYRPGESAVAEVALAGARERLDLRLTATLTADDRVEQLPVEPMPEQPGRHQVRAVFKRRGTHLFSLAAYEGENILESYEKALPVAPLLGEGAKLELDKKFLSSLAEKGAGIYVGEHEPEKLVSYLRTRNLKRTHVVHRSLIFAGPNFVLVVLAVFVLEWILRRWMNLF